MHHQTPQQETNGVEIPVQNSVESQNLREMTGAAGDPVDVAEGVVGEVLVNPVSVAQVNPSTAGSSLEEVNARGDVSVIAGFAENDHHSTIGTSLEAFLIRPGFADDCKGREFLRELKIESHFFLVTKVKWIKWESPLENVLKLNVDGASNDYCFKVRTAWGQMAVSDSWTGCLADFGGPEDGDGVEL
ncbi:unnamed protein product [Ilex paraguariensis]|uniref:Uncharacterized protein n=1 Tax=Ilex paraguariensis TaxID=185542 RepID=A0ABC8UAH5_9AQUA